MKRYERGINRLIITTSVILPLVGIGVIGAFMLGCSLMINY